MDGILLIHKPMHCTSHDVVAQMRRRLKTKRIGHAGTLDPLATGLLVLLVGKATKMSNRCVGFDKSYRATMKLGVTTTSADIMGEICQERSIEGINRAKVEESLKAFIGDIWQLPPMVSAVKVNGQRLYDLARKGVEVEREPRAVRIDQLQILTMDLPFVSFLMKCSKGTYVRQLAHDVGEKIGCGACISQIERLTVGPFDLKEAVSIEEANESHIRPWESYFS